MEPTAEDAMEKAFIAIVLIIAAIVAAAGWGLYQVVKHLF